MQIQAARTVRVQAAPPATRALKAPGLVVTPPRGRVTVAALERPPLTDVTAFMGHVVKVVSYGQERQIELERVGRAFNAGAATEQEFETARAAFQEVVDELKSLKTAGKPFNAPWWRFGGFKVDRYFENCGAAELLSYRAPSLQKPEPQKPQHSFDDLVAAAERGAKDGVDVKALLSEAADLATTVPQLVRLAGVSNAAGDDVKFTGGLFKRAIALAGTPEELKAVLNEADKGDVVIDRFGYPRLDRHAYSDVQRVALTKMGTLAKTPAELLSLAGMGIYYLDDPAFTSPLLMKALAAAKTPAEIAAVMAVAGPGDAAKNKSFTSIDVYDFDKRAYADVQRAAITRLSAMAQTQAERVRVADLSISTLDDPAFSAPLLTKALESAKTSAEIEAVLAAARPGDGVKNKSFTTIEVYDFDKRAYADVQRAAVTRLGALAQTQAERVRVANFSVDDLDDVPFTQKLLLSALNGAQTRGEIEAVLAVARKGDMVRDAAYSSLVVYNLDPAAYRDVLTAAHRRIDAIELRTIVPETTVETRVKFLLQPVPLLENADTYRGYTTKALAYMLMDLDDVKAARAAFAKGAIPKSALLDAEERLELSVGLAKALQKQATPGRISDWRAQGFDATTFWGRYPIDQLVKDALG